MRFLFEAFRLDWSIGFVTDRTFGRTLGLTRKTASTGYDLLVTLVDLFPVEEHVLCALVDP